MSLAGRLNKMTIPEFNISLKGLGWSRAAFAKKLGIAPNTISRWRTVPQYAVAYLELAAELKRLHDLVIK